jgi:hypothetical protein
MPVHGPKGNPHGKKKPKTAPRTKVRRGRKGKK